MSKFLDEAIKNINDIMEIEIKKIFGESFNGNECTASAIANTKPFNRENLQLLIERMKPYNDLIARQYMLEVPTIEIDLDLNTPYEDMSQRFLMGYNHKVISPTKTIFVKIQKRTNKNKRINKKWIKMYGYKEIKKEVMDLGIIALSTGI